MVLSYRPFGEWVEERVNILFLLQKSWEHTQAVERGCFSIFSSVVINF